MESHVRNRHLNIRPYVCELCGANYAAENELRRHMRRHGGEKEFKCELCDYASHDKGNLQSKRFPCFICALYVLFTATCMSANLFVGSFTCELVCSPSVYVQFRGWDTLCMYYMFVFKNEVLA